MKKLFTFLFWLSSFIISAQTLDTTGVVGQVDSLVKISRTLASQQAFDKAVGIIEVAEKITLQKLGRETTTYGNCCHNHGIIFLIKGDFHESERWFIEAIAIREKVLGKENPDYVKSINNLALSYRNMGNYEKAEPLYLEALTIYRKVLGNENRYYAGSLHNLAILYMDMRNYEKAESLFLESIVIAEKTLGKENPDYATSVGNLALLYFNMRNYDKAEPLYLEALAIQEKALGRENPDFAMSLNNMALLYSNMRNYEKAEPLYLEALAILEKTIGKENIRYAWSLSNLGVLYQQVGNYKKAEPLQLEAKSILEITLGKKHPDFTLKLNDLAELNWTLENYEEAKLQFQEITYLNQSMIIRAIHHLSEQELDSYLKKFSKSQNQTLSFVQFTAGKYTDITPACFDNTLFYKGFLLNANLQLKRLTLLDSATAEKYTLLKSYGLRLAPQYAKPIYDRDSSIVIELEEKANNLEKDLVRTVAGFSEAKRQVNWQEVQSQLKQDETSVEFVNFKYYNPKSTDSTMYAALLLRPGDSAPQFIPLFEEKSLDSLLQTQGERRAEYVSNLYSLVERGAKSLGQPQKSLYELLWQPLERELAGAQTIYFSPSGLLHRLNIGAIPIPPSLGGGQGETDEETLADRYRLVELGSTRQLVVPSEVKVSNQEALLFGGIKYEMDSTAISEANVDLSTETMASTRGELSFTYADSTLRGGTFNYLGGTEKEVAALEPILKSGGIQSTTRRGYAATEESFKATGRGKPSPRILHIATHGFFFPDPAEKAGSRQSAVGSSEPVFKLSDHPMIRSGLILAGGNHAWQTGKPIKPGMEDGILTAYEISQMNLSNTELVVLSACETGLGDIEGNEGVYGLQRAFKIAGAKYLIMSLWKVKDFHTQELMTLFYKRWLEDKMTIPDAFRSAQKEMREKYQDPYYWAGFVLVE